MKCQTNSEKQRSSLRQYNTALVRTAQRLSVGVQGYLPPHNFTVMLLLCLNMERAIAAVGFTAFVLLTGQGFINASFF